MKIIIDGTAKEISALILEIQERLLECEEPKFNSFPGPELLYESCSKNIP